jgi:hypothetical protein
MTTKSSVIAKRDCKPLAMTRTGFGITKHLDNYAKMFIIKKKNLTKEVISCF